MFTEPFRYTMNRYYEKGVTQTFGNKPFFIIIELFKTSKNPSIRNYN